MIDDMPALPPAPAAFAWVQATLAGDFSTSWAALDPDLRVAAVQEWIYSNPGVLDLAPDQSADNLVNDLAVEKPTHEVWHRHGRRVLRRNIEQLVEPLRGVEYAAGTKLRLIPPDLEVVMLFLDADLTTDGDGVRYFMPGEVRTVFPIVLRFIDGNHRIRGVGANLIFPGWPPTYEKVLEPED